MCVVGTYFKGQCHKVCETKFVYESAYLLSLRIFQFFFKLLNVSFMTYVESI
jgi:hypothetical protein